MKRLPLLTCSLVVLLSCTKAGSLPPDQVLQKANQAVQTLDTAKFTLKASLSGKTDALAGNWNGTAAAAGVMANKGKQLNFTLNADFDKMDQQAVQSHYTLNADVTVADENDVYLRINTLTIDPPSNLMPPALLTELQNQWWHIPGGSGSSADVADITPDPAVLEMQTSVIKVLKDRGLTTINGHEAYLYDVSIDQAKFQDYMKNVYEKQGKTMGQKELALASMQATGQIWIDTSTFFIHRIVWNISSSDAKKPFILHLDVSLSDHNTPITISIPAEAELFPGANFLPLPQAPTTPSSR